MKQLQARKVARDILNADAAYSPDLLERIERLVREFVPDDALAVVGEALARVHRRKLTHAEIAQVGYVHVRSIVENEGYSPYTRILAYLGRNDTKLDKVQVKAATDVLLDIGFIELVELENRKERKCRRYSIPTDVEQRIK